MNLVMVILSAILLWLSHPNGIFTGGLGFLAYFIYFPAFIAVYKSSFKKACLYGGIYGFLSYFLLTFWLRKYHFITLILVCVLYFILYALLFFLLKITQKLFLKNFIFVWFFIVCAYEYLITLGFLGFSYGVSAYSQWKYSAIIQSASLFGAFGLNLIVIFPSVLAFIFWKDKVFEKKLLILSALWTILFLGNFLYGLRALRKSDSSTGSVKIIAIQNNENPWKNGIEEHKKNIDKLIKLTDKALEENPDADFVVWPETAVTPSIIKNFYGMNDKERSALIIKLLDYMDRKDQIFVIGNYHEEITSDKEKKIFNTALVFEPKENVFPPEPEMYCKIHLVPVSESFPYKKIFPHLYRLLLKANTHFWEKGSEYKVFNKRNLAFSTPICFEDTFGFECRKYVKNGARCFINLSNDSWSSSLACQNQHLAAAVFRSVENRIPAVRSTSSGQTCILDSKGRILDCARPFCEAYALGEVGLESSDFSLSFYTKHGDFAGLFECLIASALLIIKSILYIIEKRGLHGRKK